MEPGKIVFALLSSSQRAAVARLRCVVIGIAQSVADLLGEHESIERSAREIYIRPLRREDVADFLAETEDALHFSFQRDVKRLIIDSSLGYPYFVHLVGLGSLDAMNDRDPEARIVFLEDYRKGLRKAVRQAFQSELRKYKEAVKGLSDKETSLLRELCLCADPTRVHRSELRKLMADKNLVTEAEFDRCWVKLQQERRIVYVSRTKDIIRFADPLMAPFLRGWFTGMPVVPADDPKQLKLI